MGNLGKAFDIISCVVDTTTGRETLPNGVAFVPQPLQVGIISVPLFYSDWGRTYSLLPTEWNRLLKDGLAVPRP